MKTKASLFAGLMFGTALLLTHQTASSETLDISTSLSANSGHGTFAPYYITSNRFGINTARNALTLRAAVINPVDSTRRLDFSYGIDLVGQAASTPLYDRFDPALDQIVLHRPARQWGWIQQLYGTMRYRSLFITLGSQQVGSALLDDDLSSGDLTWSANARPMPGLRIGFNRFVDIPLTAHALQVQAEYFVGIPTDNHWLRQHFNYWSSFITTGRINSYRRLHLRTNPSKPLYVTFGMQAATQACGNYRLYEDGQLVKTEHNRFTSSDLITLLIPRSDAAYFAGNHLGSWDIRADWRLPGSSGAKLSAYVQWPWEDGSGVGKLNGWDGLWGVQYTPGNSLPWLRSIVVEYLDFTNQSGAIHWAQHDFPGTTLTDDATGADSYYNNYFYNGYALYGLSQGTPFLRSPLYNTDGYLRYLDTRVRGVHLAAAGTLNNRIDWKLMYSWRQSLGDCFVPRLDKARDTSWSLQATYHTPRIKGLDIQAQIAMDRGTLYGNTFGAIVTIAWNGSVKIGKSK